LLANDKEPQGHFRGMEYTIRFAFKGDGDMIAPPHRTYSSQEAGRGARCLVTPSMRP
jgi:hypothetical protein